MPEITVKVIKGRETWEISGDSLMTFGQLRQSAEERVGAVEGGLRLLHKGKTFPDDATLASAKVANGTRMMAMATAKQREADAYKEKTAKSRRDSSALDAMRDRTTATASASNPVTVPSRSILGDPEIPGQTHVLLIKGRDKFRVNIALSASVGDLKNATAKLDGVDAAARDIKILFKGKFLKDAAVLSDSGIACGDRIMLLFGARHHDAEDAKAELDEIERECSKLEEKVRTVTVKASKRLLNNVDLAMARGEILDFYSRLKDNVASVRGQDERRKSLEQRLTSIEASIELIQRH